MNNYGSSNFKRDSSGYNTTYPGFVMGGNSSGGGGGYGGDGASNLLLQEQKKINDELRDEMKQMQMQIRMMTNNMMNLNQGGGSSGTAMGMGMGPGTGMGNNMMQGGGGSGVNVWNHQDGGFPSTFTPNTGFTNMGQGYRDESGGGKMGGYSAMVPSRNVPYNHRVPKQPGDWDCPQCGNMNFSRRTTCNGNGGNCGVPKKPEYVRQGVKDEKRDWTCIKCNNLNYSYRIACNKCGVDKSVGLGAEAGGGSKITKKDGDWFCPKCNNMNFSYRNKCNKCKFDKKDLVEQGPSHSSGGSMGVGPSNSMMEGMGGNNMNNIAAMMNMAMQSMGVTPGMIGMGNMGGGPMGGGPPMANSSMGGMMGGGGGGGLKMALRRHKGPDPKEGDWECPRCYNLNFSSRLACNGNKDGEFCDLQKPELQKFKVKAWKDASYIKDSDWDCWICSNVNFANRESCNKCKTDKADAQSDALRKKRSS